MGCDRYAGHIGFDPLYGEMLASALSIRGWQLVDCEGELPQATSTPEIILVGASDEPELVIARIRRARTEFPSAKLVLLGLAGAEAQLVRFIEEGVCAWLPSSKRIADLINTLEMVRENRTLSSGSVTRLVLESIRRLSRKHRVVMDAPLTDRESEVLLLINEGLSNKEIASRLSISPSTVKNHVHHLLEKLKVGSRHEAAWRSARRPVQPARVAARSLGEL